MAHMQWQSNWLVQYRYKYREYLCKPQKRG
jgi:hypothetical protein